MFCTTKIIAMLSVVFMRMVHLGRGVHLGPGADPLPWIQFLVDNLDHIQTFHVNPDHIHIGEQAQFIRDHIHTAEEFIDYFDFLDFMHTMLRHQGNGTIASNGTAPAPPPPLPPAYGVKVKVGRLGSNVESKLESAQLPSASQPVYTRILLNELCETLMKQFAEAEKLGEVTKELEHSVSACVTFIGRLYIRKLVRARVVAQVVAETIGVSGFPLDLTLQLIWLIWPADPEQNSTEHSSQVALMAAVFARLDDLETPATPAPSTAPSFPKHDEEQVLCPFCLQDEDEPLIPPSCMCLAGYHLSCVLKEGKTRCPNCLQDYADEILKELPPGAFADRWEMEDVTGDFDVNQTADFEDFLDFRHF